MVVQEFIDCLTSQSASSEQLKELQKSAKEYPFVAVFQQLAYNGLSTDQVDSKRLASLYKTNPFLFIYNKKQFTIGHKEVVPKDKIQDSEPIIETAVLETAPKSNTTAAVKEETEEELVIMPLHAADYFTAQGIKASETEVEAFVSEEKERVEKVADNEPVDEKAQLLITRSFQDWLDYFKEKREKEQKENEEKQALRAMWQKEKLSVASEEENDLVPEQVFKMAIDSLQPSEGSISEALANILVKQGKYSRAIEMYRKLSLQNPKKSAYFAAKLKEVEKLK
jgi:tetratricopeptide (TPR) repeat protein